MVPSIKAKRYIAEYGTVTITTTGQSGCPPLNSKGYKMRTEIVIITIVANKAT